MKANGTMNSVQVPVAAWALFEVNPMVMKTHMTL